MTRPRDSARPAVYDLHFEHVSPDGAVVDTSFERTARTAVPEAEVVAILQRFANIAPLSTLECEPQITVRASHLHLQARPHRGQLLVRDPADPELVWRELAPDKLIPTLRAAPPDDSAVSPPAASEAETAPPPALPLRTRHWALAVFLLGIAFNGYVLVSLFLIRPAPDFVPAGDGHPSVAVLKEISGNYLAGPPAPFAQIELRPPDHIVFRDVQGQPETDSFLYGSHDGRPRLLTGRHGFIDLTDGGTLTFSARRYERTGAKR